MECTHCGAENAIFCGRCGKPFSDTVVVQRMPMSPPSETISNQRNQTTRGGSGRLAKFLGLALIIIGICAACLVAGSTALSVSRLTSAAQATENYLEGAVELLVLAVSFLALNATILLFKKR
jgi:hypothetical protein